MSYEVTIGPRAADYRSDFNRLGRDIENLVSPPAQVSTLRGLNPGEQKHLERIEDFVGHWIPDHPDLVGDVSAVLNGLRQSGGGGFDHVREARERAGMLNKSLEQLQRALDSGKLSDESRQAVEQALEQGRAAREWLRQVLGDLDTDALSEEDYLRLRDALQDSNSQDGGQDGP